MLIANTKAAQVVRTGEVRDPETGEIARVETEMLPVGTPYECDDAVAREKIARGDAVAVESAVLGGDAR